MEQLWNCEACNIYLVSGPLRKSLLIPEVIHLCEEMAISALFPPEVLAIACNGRKVGKRVWILVIVAFAFFSWYQGQSWCTQLSPTCSSFLFLLTALLLVCHRPSFCILAGFDFIWFVAVCHWLGLFVKRTSEAFHWTPWIANGILASVV